jgi:hypothetical protein
LVAGGLLLPSARAAEPDAGPAAASADLLQAQLEAGEFGPALATLKSIDDGDHTRLLQMVADAQIQAGEFDAARNTIRRMPAGVRGRAAGERTGRETMAGGGVNIDELIELIQNNTGEPEGASWSEGEAGEGIGTIDTWDPGGLQDGGVRVDPNGLLYRLTRAERDGRLAALGARARRADLNDDMARTSELRLVSLTRLQQETARRLAEGQPIVASMKNLAGLSQIRYVFVFPEEREIVIGGPAEAWEINDNGTPVGTVSGRPTLQLDDFVTVLRTFAPGGPGIFRCSINPREEGLKQLKDFVEKSNAAGPIKPASVKDWVAKMEAALGPQDVEIEGVPVESRVARVIVEADYRMKLIGIDKLENGAGIPSFFDLLPQSEQKNAADVDALRWWLTMKYDAVMHSPDRDVFEVQGSSVLCQSENELITALGQRVPTGKSEATNRLFAQRFTEKYPQLAQGDLIFADLQNVFDLALVAALIRHERLDQRTGWQPGVFAADGQYRTTAFAPAKTATSVANHRTYRGRDIVVQVAGGVRGDLLSVVQDDQVYRETDRLRNVTAKGRPPQLPEGRWWWDATLK